ncbi:MAG: ABC transporter permease [Solirubrobacterales bacterium]|nr:ABC transporter permease [Solirubrobacterales bacterium]
MPSLTFKNLWSHKWRSLMTALAVIFGIALVSGTYVLTDTTNQAFDRIFTDSIAGTDVTVTARSEVDQQGGETPDFPARYLPEVEAVPGVKKASGEIFSAGAILDARGDSIGGGFAPQFISSVTPQPFQTLEYVEGREPAGPGQASLDEASAERAGIGIGDRIQLIGTGRAVPFRVVGLTRLGGASFGGTAIAQVPLPVARSLTGKQDRFDQISVAADDGVSPGQLKQRVERVVPHSLLVETGQENADRNSDQIRDSLKFLTIALLAFAAIALFVGSFVIFNVFSITVAQRTREFGMLRTLGANRSQILRSVLLEGALVGLFGAIAGLLLGVGLAKGLSVVMKAVGADLPANSLVLAPRTVVVSLLIGVGVTLLASLIPAMRSTRVPPIAALTEAMAPARARRVVVRTVIAGLLAAVGLALVMPVLIGGMTGGRAAAMIGGGAVSVALAISVFAPRLIRPAASIVGLPLERLGGMTGRLARENSQRNPGRTAITSAALMIGLALVAFVTVFASGLSSSVNKVIEESLPGEITLQGPGGFTPIPPGAVRTVADMEGVDAASGIRYATVRIDGSNTVLSGVDPAAIAKVFDTDWKDGSEADLTGLKDDQIVIGSNLADRAGLGVGDRVTVLTQKGDKPTFTVTAITESESISFAGDAIVTLGVMKRVLGVPTDAVGLVRLDPGADSDAVQQRIENRLKKPFPTVDVLNQDELKQNQKQQINGLLSMIYVLLALAVIVSLVGIVVTLILSIHERTRELGMLRSIGMSRRQVRRMVRYEAVITAVIGALAGLVLGVVFAFLIGIPLSDEGFSLSYPVGTLAVILVLTGLAGVLAAIYPARKAAKLDVLEAVSYE